MHRNVTADSDWEAYEERIESRESEFKGKAKTPAESRWQGDEWARSTSLEKKLREMAWNIPSERKAMLTAEAAAVINESYVPPEGKAKPSAEAVKQVAKTLSAYCTAFKCMPNECKISDEAEQESIMSNNQIELFQWPTPIVKPPSGWEDRWEVFIQRLYLRHLEHDGLGHDWIQLNFADLYHLAFHPVSWILLA